MDPESARAVTINETGNTTDNFAATYQSRDDKGNVKQPAEDLEEFLKIEFIPYKLEPFRQHMWAIGSERAAAPLNYQVAFGRGIVACEDINLHLVWSSSGKIYVKPLPCFLLDEETWKEHFGGPLCQEPTYADTIAQRPLGLENNDINQELTRELRSCALGFLYSYICLIAHESDFAIAREKHLLPLSHPSQGFEVDWVCWKKFSRLVLLRYRLEEVHWRFRYGELRLSRLNFFRRFTHFPPFTSYLRGWRTYGNLVRDNVTWLGTAAVFVALVLTALQVGLATNQLKDNDAFVRFSYGFSVFSIAAPVGAFLFIVVEVVYNIIKDNIR